MKYNLVIFDMDGTILSTLEDLCDSVNVILKKYDFPLHTLEEIRFMVGHGIPNLIHQAVPAQTEETVYKNVLADFIEYYNIHCADKTRPYDGIPELIKKLKEQNIKVAVNTNKLQLAAVELCNLYFNGLFDIICGNTPEIPVKPAPDGVHKIMKESGIPLNQIKAVYIGDSDVDYETGMNSKIDFIGCDWGFRGEKLLRQKGAKVIAMKPSEIFDLVK